MYFLQNIKETLTYYNKYTTNIIAVTVCTSGFQGFRRDFGDTIPNSR